MAHGCPDTGINDPGVGFGLRDTGVHRNDEINGAVVKIDNGVTHV